jgi:ubiquitin
VADNKKKTPIAKNTEHQQCKREKAQLEEEKQKKKQEFTTMNH